MRPSLSTLAGLALACLSCAGLAEPNATIAPEASSLTYHLPATSLDVALRVVITSCAGAPQGRASLELTPVAGAEAESFTIAGSSLRSFRLKRELKLSLHPNGTLASVNGGVTDRSGAILVDLLSLGAKLAVLAGAAPEAAAEEVACTDETAANVARADELAAGIASLQRQIHAVGRPSPAVAQRKIDVLAAELARVRREGLTAELRARVEFSRASRSGWVRWRRAELSRWLRFGEGDARDPARALALYYCVAPGRVASCVLPEADAAPTSAAPDAAAAPSARDGCGKDAGCRTTLVFREPVPAEIVFLSASANLDRPRAAELRRVLFPMSQYGDFSYLPLTVAFAGSKSVSLGLDEFGRKTSLAWSSGATGENLVAGLSGAAEAATSLRDAVDGQRLREQKARIEALETQQKLNRLERCAEILSAGGFVCPTE